MTVFAINAKFLSLNTVLPEGPASFALLAAYS